MGGGASYRYGKVGYRAVEHNRTGATVPPTPPPPTLPPHLPARLRLVSPNAKEYRHQVGLLDSALPTESA